MLHNCIIWIRNHGAHRAPWLTIILSILMVILYGLGAGPFDLLLLDKAAVLDGEVWRLITGHFVHCNTEHLFWDLLAFVIIGAVIELNDRKHLLPVLLASCVFVSAWLFLVEPRLSTYCGLSGALNGMFVLGVIMQWRATNEKMYLYVLIAMILKITFEFISDETIFTNLGAQAVPGSHAAGFIAGLVYIIGVRRR